MRAGDRAHTTPDAPFNAADDIVTVLEVVDAWRVRVRYGTVADVVVPSRYLTGYDDPDLFASGGG